MRMIDSDERDAYMGHKPGISAQHMAEDGTCTVSDVSESYRRELMGGKLHEAHVWAYFNQRSNKPVLVAKTMLTQVHMATPEQFKLFLSSFDTNKARREWFRENAIASDEMLELHLKVDLQDGPSQLMHNHGTGGRLDASMSYALQLLVEEGRIEEVDWHKDFFISPCFPKQKVGRKFDPRPGPCPERFEGGQCTTSCARHTRTLAHQQPHA